MIYNGFSSSVTGGLFAWLQLHKGWSISGASNSFATMGHIYNSHTWCRPHKIIICYILILIARLDYIYICIYTDMYASWIGREEKNSWKIFRIINLCNNNCWVIFSIIVFIYLRTNIISSIGHMLSQQKQKIYIVK